MAVLVNKQTGNVVEGGYKAATDIKPGQFVQVNYANKTASLSGGSNVKLVLQRNDSIDQEAIADSDVVYKAGEYLPLRTLQLGDVITDDIFDGAFSDFNIGAEVIVDASGVLKVAGADPEGLIFQVKDKTTLFGKEAIKVEVVSV